MDTATFDIRIDPLRDAKVIDLLEQHLQRLRRVSPPESTHALDLEGLRRPDIVFWTAWDGPGLAGCAALKALDAAHAEIKSMRTADAYLRRGVATLLLRHLLAEAARRGFRRLSLETGSMDYFAPARQLYATFGFAPCAPFGTYSDDPNSAYMTRKLPEADPACLVTRTRDAVSPRSAAHHRDTIGGWRGSRDPA